MSDESKNNSTALSNAANLTGRRLGDLQILRRLGRGGMADVYVANQVTLGRRVALKILRSDLAKDASYVERFRREARAAASLTHPNIVQVYEVGCEDSMHYISQEYVDGLNLRQQLDRTGPLSVDQAIVILQSVANALAAASSEGVTHRDIKPENVMVNQRGEVKVADFGLARVTQGEGQNDLTQIGMTMGTPLYMSPEQVQGQAVDVRSDLYSLGVTIYHLLAGRPPFEAETPLALAVKHLHETAAPVSAARLAGDLPDWLSTAITKLMEKFPNKRFQSPEELSEYIQRSLVSNGAVGDATTRLATRIDATKTLQQLISSERRKESRLPGVLTGVAVLLPLGALAVGVWLGVQQPRASIAAQLSPGQIEVRTRESVEAQYLEAARLNEPEGWLKVLEAFPAEANKVNAAYAVKAKIQLARLYRERANYEGAMIVLKEVLIDAELQTMYKAIALAEKYQTQNDSGDAAGAAVTVSELRQTYQSLQSTTDKQKLKIFDDVVPSGIVLSLQES